MAVNPDRVTGALLGVALGDALGLAMEGMRAETIARRFGPVARFHVLGRRGFVSDDTEQTALLAQALVAGRGDRGQTVRLFRRSLAGWFLRLPWGVGFSTVKACLLISLGVTNSGRPSAGNGSAMRAIPLALAFPADADSRRAFGRALAEQTHTDPRAVEGALFVAELAAGCLSAESHADRSALVHQALVVVEQPELRAAIEAAAGDAAPPSSGYVVHTLQAALHYFLTAGDQPLSALQACIANGGDTDSIAAILGGWLGALHGETALPSSLIAQIHDGPFGPTHLRALAAALCDPGAPPPTYSWPAAMARNLALYPVVLAHGFRRLLPF